MPGDPFKKALPGQRLVIPADAFNGFVDAANYVRARRHNTESDAADEFRQTGIVRVRNNTGFALPRFAVLALSEPIVGPAANLQEFKNKVNFEGSTTKCGKGMTVGMAVERHGVPVGVLADAANVGEPDLGERVLEQLPPKIELPGGCSFAMSSTPSSTTASCTSRVR